MAEEAGAGRLGVEVVGCGLIQVEAPRGCSDADLPVLSSDHKQVHEVPMHLAVPRRWVPATHGEHFQTLQGLPVTVLGLQGTQRPLPAPWQDILRWCAVDGVHLQAFLPLPTVS